MEKLKNKLKNVKGITLISLIITIIILIILAGVTINMLLGENGLITRTKTAKEENEKATATETMNLKITNVQISKYAEEQRMPTLKELADNFCEDDDFQYVQETSKIASLTKISNNNPTSIYTKLKAYPYEFEINSSLQLANIDGVKVASNESNDYISKAQYDSIISDINTLKNQIQTLQQNSVRFVNFNDVIDSTTLKSKGATYTATRDCAIVGSCTNDEIDKGAQLLVNGVMVSRAYSYYDSKLTYAGVGSVTYVKAGDVVTTRADMGQYDYTVYGLMSATPTN